MKNVKKIVYYTIARGSRGAQIYLDKGLFMKSACREIPLPLHHSQQAFIAFDHKDP